jgi:hypothetical protein
MALGDLRLPDPEPAEALERLSTSLEDSPVRGGQSATVHKADLRSVLAEVDRLQRLVRALGGDPSW